MTKIFLDCGFYVGIATKQYLEKGILNKNWQVYGFEPNDEVNPKEEAKKLPLNIKIIPKAVWIKNGKVDFWVSERNNASSVDGTTKNAPKEKISVPSINFSKFVEKLPKNSYIVCSMDIEGSEFPVLEKMLKDGTIDRIRILDIEFHHRFLLDQDSKTAKDLIKRIQARGVRIKLKVGLE